LNSGSFGEIYLGIDLRTNEKVAIKVESKDSKYPQLIEEYNVYRKIKPGAGVPSVYYCGETANWNCMVMELLGDSLETLYNKCGRKFSLKTITMIAIQLLHRIEHHHNGSHLHRDIKVSLTIEIFKTEYTKSMCRIILIGWTHLKLVNSSL